MAAFGFRHRTVTPEPEAPRVSRQVVVAPAEKTPLELSLQKDFAHWQQIMNLYEEAWYQVNGQRLYNRPNSVFKILVDIWPRFSLDERSSKDMRRLVYLPKSTKGTCSEPLTLMYRQEPATHKYSQGQLSIYDCKSKKHEILASWRRTNAKQTHVKFFAEKWQRMTDMGILNSLNLSSQCEITDGDADSIEKLECTHLGQKSRKENQHIYSLDFEKFSFEKNNSQMLKLSAHRYETLDRFEQIDLDVPMTGPIQLKTIRLKPLDGDKITWSPLAVEAAVDVKSFDAPIEAPPAPPAPPVPAAPVAAAEPAPKKKSAPLSALPQSATVEEGAVEEPLEAPQGEEAETPAPEKYQNLSTQGHAPPATPNANQDLPEPGAELNTEEPAPAPQAPPSRPKPDGSADTGEAAPQGEEPPPAEEPPVEDGVMQNGVDMHELSNQR